MENNVDKELNALHSAIPSEEIPLSTPITESTLDGMIQDHDPEFAESLKSIDPKNLNSQELADLDKELAEARKRSFRLRIQLAFKSFVFRIELASLEIVRRLKVIVTVKIPKFLKWNLGLLKSFFAWLGKNASEFSGLTKTQKLGLALVLVVASVSAYLSFEFYKGHYLFSTKTQFFLTNLDAKAKGVQTFSPAEDYESFYDSPRVTLSVVLLKRMVANLMATQSSPRPMIATEIFLEGVSQEVLLKAKEREAEILDRIQRVMEGFTFEKLDTTSGKQLLLERIREESNQVLGERSIRRARYKTLVIKP